MREKGRLLREFSHIIILLLIQLSLICDPYSVPKSPNQNIPRNKSPVSIALLKKVRLKSFIKKITALSYLVQSL